MAKTTATRGRKPRTPTPGFVIWTGSEGTGRLRMNSLPSKVLARVKRQPNWTIATADIVTAFGPSARNALNKLIQTGALQATVKPVAKHDDRPRIVLPDDGPNYDRADAADAEPIPGSAEVVQRGEPLRIDGQALAPFSGYGSQWLQNMVFTAAEVPSHERREVFATACEILKALVR